MGYNPSEDPNLEEFRDYWNNMPAAERNQIHRDYLNSTGVSREGLTLDPALAEVPTAPVEDTLSTIRSRLLTQE